MTGTLRLLCRQACATAITELRRQKAALNKGDTYLDLVSNRRSVVIVTRVRVIAALFALLTPLWLVIDICAFPRQVWVGLGLARILAALGFLGIFLVPWKAEAPRHAYGVLAALLAVPTAFFLFSFHHVRQFELDGIPAAFAAGYGFLPFVMVAGLSLFPLTLMESLTFSAPMLMVQALTIALSLPLLDWPAAAASFWLLLLITGVSAMAGTAQLGYMAALVHDVLRDGLTGCYSRNGGKELLNLQFVLSERNRMPVAAAFIDLDRFKEINDTFGHDAGDGVLVAAVASIRKYVRVGDMLTRWGGEEFLLVMPNTTMEDACVALRRMTNAGLGRRGDGAMVTASIGIAERIGDGVETWEKLVEKADNRMYMAKRLGRNRVVVG